MRLAVDARFAVLDERGIGRVTRALLAQLRRVPDVALTLVVPGPFAPRRRIAAALGIAARELARAVPSDADVLWSPSNGTDLTCVSPCVTTVHDVVPFTFAAAGRARRRREQTPLLRTAARAQAIVTPSAFMADQIGHWLAVERERITVVPHGVAAPFVRAGARFALPDGRQYVLHVGAHDRRKNVDTLIAAWQGGVRAAETALVFTQAPAVCPAGALVVDARADERLAELYRGAALVAVPSLDEGFGLPVLEALACGAPVVASRVAALPEVGAEAVAWVDAPASVEGWSHALGELLGDPGRAAALAARGPARAAAYTWERSAQRMLDVFRAAATKPRGAAFPVT